jgi:cation transporter-like permease
MKHSFRTSFSFVALTTGLASCISLIGGIGLESIIERILPLVPLIIALPALNTMVGDYAAIIASHAGDPDERKTTKKALIRAISRAIIVNIVGLLVLSILLAWRNGYIFEDSFLIKFAIFIPTSMIGIVIAMYTITSLLDRLLSNKKLNPDDILIPIVTSISDVLMLGLVAIAVVTIF